MAGSKSQGGKKRTFKTERCNQCGNKLKKLGSHWLMSSSCDYPEPSKKQEKIIQGILLSGVGVKQRSHTHNPYIEITTTRHEVGKSVSNALGNLSQFRTDLTEKELNPQKNKLDASVKSERYILRLRNNPNLNKFKSNGVDTLSKTTLATVFLLRGNYNDANVPYVNFGHLSKSLGWWKKELQTYNARVEQRYGGISDGDVKCLVLTDVDKFYTELEQCFRTFKRP